MTNPKCECGAKATFLCKSDGIYICENSDHISEHLEKGRTPYHEINLINADPTKFPPTSADEDLNTLRDSGLSLFPHIPPINSISISNNSLYTAERESICKFDLKSQSRSFKIGVKSIPWSVSASKDGKFVAVGLDDGTLVVFDAGTGEEYFKVSPFDEGYSVTTVNFAENSLLLFAGSNSKVLNAYDVSTKKMYMSKVNDAPVLCSAVCPMSKYVMTGTTVGGIIVFDVGKKEKKTSLKEHTDAVISLCVTSKGMLVSGSFDGLLYIWGAEDFGLLRTFSNYRCRIISVTSHPDGNLIYFTDAKNSLKIYNIESKKAIKKTNDGEEMLTCLTFDPTSDLIYGVCGERTIMKFQPQDLSVVGSVGNEELVLVKITNDKKFVVCGFRDGWVKFFNLTTSVIEHDSYFMNCKDIFSQYPELGIELEERSY